MKYVLANARAARKAHSIVMKRVKSASAMETTEEVIAANALKDLVSIRFRKANVLNFLNVLLMVEKKPVEAMALVNK